jgi:uncharacterized protein
MGDCQKHRVNNGIQTLGISHLCAGWRHFFSHTKEPFIALEKMLKTNRITDLVTFQTSLNAKKLPTTGCNQPCHSGSGSKYKKCCAKENIFKCQIDPEQMSYHRS